MKAGRPGNGCHMIALCGATHLCLLVACAAPQFQEKRLFAGAVSQQRGSHATIFASPAGLLRTHCDDVYDRLGYSTNIVGCNDSVITAIGGNGIEVGSTDHIVVPAPATYKLRVRTDDDERELELTVQANGLYYVESIEETAREILSGKHVVYDHTMTLRHAIHLLAQLAKRIEKWHSREGMSIDAGYISPDKRLQMDAARAALFKRLESSVCAAPPDEQVGYTSGDESQVALKAARVSLGTASAETHSGRELCAVLREDHTEFLSDLALERRRLAK